MRKILFLLAFVSTLAHAQYYGGYLPLKGGTVTGTLGVTGNVNVQGNVSSAANTLPAGTTNSGIALIASPNIADIDFFDASQSVNNRTASWLFFQGALRARFYNDSHSTAVEPLVFTGGQAGGLTSIASGGTAGAPWTHTGLFTATSGAQLPITTVAALPACVAGLTGVMRAVSDAATITYNATATGGGTSATATVPVMCNGTNWTYH